MNIGGARPSGISMPTFAQPGRHTYCIGENEEESPWAPLHTGQGFSADDSAVAVIAAEAPQVVSDSVSVTARELLTTIARSGQVIASYRHAELSDAVLVISPEHARFIARESLSKRDVRESYGST